MIRSPLSSDGEALEQVALASFHTAWDPIVGEGVVENYVRAELSPEHWRQLAAKADPMAWVFVDGETTVGFCVMDPDEQAPDWLGFPGSLLLQRLYIHPDYQGKGAGKALLFHALDYARERGFTGVWLVTDQRNPQAWNFYLRHGFTPFLEQNYVYMHNGEIVNPHSNAMTFSF